MLEIEVKIKKNLVINLCVTNEKLTRYSVEPRACIFKKRYGFLSFAKNMGKNINKSVNKNISDKSSQETS